jgi:hypothetical protein
MATVETSRNDENIVAIREKNEKTRSRLIACVSLGQQEDLKSVNNDRRQEKKARSDAIVPSQRPLCSTWLVNEIEVD